MMKSFAPVGSPAAAAISRHSRSRSAMGAGSGASRIECFVFVAGISLPETTTRRTRNVPSACSPGHKTSPQRCPPCLLWALAGTELEVQHRGVPVGLPGALAGTGE